MMYIFLNRISSITLAGLKKVSHTSLTLCRQQHFRPKITPKLDYNLNTTKDLVLYSHNRTRFFRLLSIFGVLQAICFLSLAEFSFRGFKKVDLGLDKKDPKDETKYVSYLREATLKNGMGVVYCICGFSLGFLSLLYCSRSIRTIILHKGGNMLTLITYHPLKSKASITVPLELVSAKIARDSNASYHVPIKVKNQKFYFVIDKRGTFDYPELFDLTIGLARSWHFKNGFECSYFTK